MFSALTGDRKASDLKSSAPVVKVDIERGRVGETS